MPSSPESSDESPPPAGAPPAGEERADSEPREQRSWPRRLLNRLEVDRAVFFAVLARGWQLAAGPVSLLLIAAFFSPELQGWYYTFSSLLALQAFVELGFPLVLINLASHEWSRLQLHAEGGITGEPRALSRLASLMRLSLRWYAGAAMCFTGLVLPAGVLFFRQQPEAGTIGWEGPWLVLVVLTACSLVLQPLVALLDGCNQMATVNRYRLLQSVGSSLAVWACLPLGAGLWTTVAVAGVRLLTDLLLTGVRYRRLLVGLWQEPLSVRVAWADEVRPLQWRLALQAAFGFLMHWLFSPVLFHYHGAAVAGQMGMSLTILLTLQMASVAWVETRSPLFGMLVARRDFRELDRVFLRVSGLALAVYGSGALAAVGCLYLLHRSGVPELAALAQRLLPPEILAILLGGAMFDQLVRCQKYYLRAFQRDPQTAMTVAGQLVTGLLVWQCGRHYGAWGAVVAWAGMHVVWFAPVGTWIWLRCRQEWQTERAARHHPPR